jgi:pimeloyl-ACP methyl ester carboxylesterase
MEIAGCVEKFRAAEVESNFCSFFLVGLFTMSTEFLGSDGKTICCVLVHGTRLLFSFGGRWIDDPDSAMRRAIKTSTRCVDFESFRWSGSHNQAARRRAAEGLRARLTCLRARYDKVVVIGHSHGGNVGLQAVQALPDDAVSLITLATPFFYVRPVSVEQNVRTIMGSVVTIIFMLAVAAIFIKMPFDSYVTILTFGAAVALFVVAVLTSRRWGDRLSRLVAPSAAARRLNYVGMGIERPIKLLVVYYAGQDGVTDFFNRIRRCSLTTAKWSRKLYARAAAEDQRWLARSPNRIPAICIGAAGFLTLLAAFGVNQMHQQLLAVSVMALLCVGLAVLIRNYFLASLRGSAALGAIYVNQLSKLMYSGIKSGALLDFLCMFIRTQPEPFNPHRYPLTLLCLDKDDLISPRRFPTSRDARLRTHTRIIAKKEALTPLAAWIAAEV